MKKGIFIVLMVLILIGIVATLMSQTLPVDSRKKEMQFHKSFTALRYSPPADTVWRKVVIPDRTMEVWCIADSGAIAISPDSLYYKTEKPYAYVSKDTPFTLPTYKTGQIWVRRAASGTSTHLNMVFMRM